MSENCHCGKDIDLKNEYPCQYMCNMCNEVQHRETMYSIDEQSKTGVCNACIRTQGREMAKVTIEIKPCPFCGEYPEILVTDDEGNTHDEDDYLDRCWSGLMFALTHPAKNCPIATDEEEKYMYLYPTANDAVESWNLRENKGENK